MAQFKPYPKIMKHPLHAPAEFKTLPGNGKGLFAPDTVQTKAERLPDVTVTNEEQEKKYAALGYRPPNVNAKEYEQAILENNNPDDFSFWPYPAWRYHAIHAPVIVKNEEEDRELGEEWSTTPLVATEDDLIRAQIKEAGGKLPEQTPTTKENAA